MNGEEDIRREYVYSLQAFAQGEADEVQTREDCLAQYTRLRLDDLLLVAEHDLAAMLTPFARLNGNGLVGTNDHATQIITTLDGTPTIATVTDLIVWANKQPRLRKFTAR